MTLGVRGQARAPLLGVSSSRRYEPAADLNDGLSGEAHGYPKGKALAPPGVVCGCEDCEGAAGEVVCPWVTGRHSSGRRTDNVLRTTIAPRILRAGASAEIGRAAAKDFVSSGCAAHQSWTLWRRCC
jgi:hypothetical protein